MISKLASINDLKTTVYLWIPILVFAGCVPSISPSDPYLELDLELDLELGPNGTALSLKGPYPCEKFCVEKMSKRSRHC